ncbi:MAG: Gfo/Idh/MocA family oxidoreductase [Verrucomicrobiae bacterium]|nr:Gfo/Idh/MocA family oxidoreductase [Verrucomicrobiae bacterium]
MKRIPSSPRISRRRFLAAAGAGIALPTFVPATVFGAAGRPAPSNRITMGVVGWGMQGPGNTGNFMRQPDCQVVASANIDRNHLQASLRSINRHYDNRDCRAYEDYREMLARKDIDTVMLAVPDQWHGVMSVEAARSGKDIFGEKPLARTIAEQQAIVRAVQSNQRIWQTGSWQRSERNFHYAAEIVRNGLIGRVTRVEVGLPSGHHDFAGTGKPLIEALSRLPDPVTNLSRLMPGTPAWKVAMTAPPSELQYDRWIGPARMEPYVQARVHMNWRWNYNTGGGQLLDWIGHHGDIAHWGLGNDDRIGPSEVSGTGEFPAAEALWNTCTRYRITCRYPNDIELVIAGGHNDIRGGTKWVGTDGWVWVNRGNGFEASNKAWEENRRLPEELRKVKLPFAEGGHYRNFLDSVKSRQPTVTPVEVAHCSAVPGHLGLIAMLTGRKIRWDAEREQILNDPGASELLSRPTRAPWSLG